MSGLRKVPVSGSDALVHATAAFLRKLSKHVALIGCLMIVGAASGRETIGQLTIFFTVVIAALLHGTGCYLQERVLKTRPQPRYER